MNFIQTIFWYLKIYIGYQELFSFFYIMKYQEIFFEISNSNYWFSNSLFDIRNASKILKPRHIRYSYHTHECNTLYLNNLVLDKESFYTHVRLSTTVSYKGNQKAKNYFEDFCSSLKFFISRMRLNRKSRGILNCKWQEVYTSMETLNSRT